MLPINLFHFIFIDWFFLIYFYNYIKYVHGPCQIYKTSLVSIPDYPTSSCPLYVTTLLMLYFLFCISLLSAITNHHVLGGFNNTDVLFTVMQWEADMALAGQNAMPAGLGASLEFRRKCHFLSFCSKDGIWRTSISLPCGLFSPSSMSAVLPLSNHSSVVTSPLPSSFHTSWPLSLHWVSLNNSGQSPISKSFI